MVWQANDIPALDGKVIIVTGGNGGIGYGVCKELLLKGAKVYLAARSSAKTEEAFASLKRETGKDDSLFLLNLNLSDLRAVRTASEQFLAKESKLDVLINNAGVMAAPLTELTKDGYDVQWGVNVLGHFHLTTLLLPALLAADAPARVVNLSSAGHMLTVSGGVDFDHLKGPKSQSWFPPLATIQRYQWYGQSKGGNILISNELAARYPDKIVSIAVHPGGNVISSLNRHHVAPIRWFLNSISNSLEYGCATPLYAATAPEAAKLTGKYLVPIAQQTNPSSYAQDPELGRKVWAWCEAEAKGF